MYRFYLIIVLFIIMIIIIYYRLTTISHHFPYSEHQNIKKTVIATTLFCLSCLR